MSRAGLTVFDTTIQETNLWLKCLMEISGINDRQFAFTLLKGVLHALRDRIGPENAVHLGAQLPLLLRGVYYEGWRPSETPTRERHVGDFLDHVSANLTKTMECDIEPGVRADFETLWRKIDPDEVIKIIRIMPMELRELWQTPAPGE
jgi:uncharacterized protein (DUF2267 family)